MDQNRIDERLAQLVPRLEREGLSLGRLPETFDILDFLDRLLVSLKTRQATEDKKDEEMNCVGGPVSLSQMDPKQRDAYRRQKEEARNLTELAGGRIKPR